jgi:hypothetical protein
MDGIFYHPMEKLGDALATIKLVSGEIDNIDLFIIGDFDLTPGSIISKMPDKFCIDNIYYTAGDDFRLFPLFINKFKNHSKNYMNDIDDKINQLSSNYSLNHYPWAGSISTHHSFLYFLRFGQDIFLELALSKYKFLNAIDKKIAKLKVREKFSLKKISEFEEEAINKYINESTKAVINKKNSKIETYAMLSRKHFEEYINSI